MKSKGHTESKLDFIPAKDIEVRCHRCHWEGKLAQLVVIYDRHPTDPFDVIGNTGCPGCLSDRWLDFKEEHNG